ncbi:MAG: tRNA lysidine(34) synthetase TilS [Oscillospiraceae bacterium]|nr:tRNA lysidine(34) synthetase TilS [Oscillospiraceae bacterium]
MRRSEPLELLELIRARAAEYDMLPADRAVLAAVSGGADSMCLMHALYELAPEMGFKLAVVHYDHGLRGGESAADAAFVRAQAEKLGLEYMQGSGDVAAYARENSLGTEEAARQLRYDFFEDCAAKLGDAKVATAHTADDNAETVLMNLLRGAGLRGLRGIPPVRGRFVRPMLDVSRQQVMDWLEARGIEHVEDSSNSGDEYTRNRLRHHVIPLLRDINPELNGAVGRMTRIIAAEDDWLDGRARELMERAERDGGLDAGLIATADEVIAKRCLRLWLGSGVGEVHIQAALELCGNENPSASIDLPGMRLCRSYGTISRQKPGEEAPEGFPELSLRPGESVNLPGTKYAVSMEEGVFDSKICKSLNTFLFKTAEIYGNITLRPRRPGDSMKIGGCTKTLKKLYIERRIPARQRGTVPVAADEKGPLAVLGIGPGDRAVPGPGDRVFILRFTEIQANAE